MQQNNPAFEMQQEGVRWQRPGAKVRALVLASSSVEPGDIMGQCANHHLTTGSIGLGLGGVKLYLLYLKQRTIQQILNSLVFF